MNSGIKFGLSDIKLQNSDGEFIPICSTSEMTLSVEENKEENNNYYDFIKDINKTVEMSSFTIRAKKRGNEIEKCLYYQKNKKKRIRKKWNFERRILGIR